MRGINKRLYRAAIRADITMEYGDCESTDYVPLRNSMPICSSPACTSVRPMAEGSTKEEAVKKINGKPDYCPDCGWALFWKKF